MEEIKVLQIETTNNCNNSCVFCPHKDIGFKQIMDMSLFKKIIDEAKLLGIKKIIPFLNGEPLLDPLFFERLKYIREVMSEDTIIDIYTNGSLLNDDVVESFNDYGVNFINISLNASTESTYKKVTNSNNFKKIEENAAGCINKFNGNVRISFVPTYENKHEIDSFLDKWSGFDCEVQINDVYNWAGKVYKSETRIEPCFRLMEHLTVLSSGNVCLCCMDFKTVVGDLNVDSIKKVWEDNKWRRKMHLKGKRPMMKSCQNCNMK